MVRLCAKHRCHKQRDLNEPRPKRGWRAAPKSKRKRRSVALLRARLNISTEVGAKVEAHFMSVQGLGQDAGSACWARVLANEEDIRGTVIGRTVTGVGIREWRTSAAKAAWRGDFDRSAKALRHPMQKHCARQMQSAASAGRQRCCVAGI